MDNAVDEAMAGHNDAIEVTIHPDNSVTVRDRGRGIPVDMIEEQGLPAMTVVLTKLHAGGKFGGEGYKVSGGLHGVGVSVVNALSEWLVAEVERDGKVYRQEFARGVPQGDDGGRRRSAERRPARRSRSCPTRRSSRSSSSRRETSSSACARRRSSRAGLRITITDERAGGERVEFHYEGGIKDFVAYSNEAKDAVHRHIVYFENETDAGLVEVAMQWNTSYQESVFSFANNINTHRGRHPLSGVPLRAHARR